MLPRRPHDRRHHLHEGHSHSGDDTHVAGGPPTEYDWKVHHPYGGMPGRAAVEVSPKRGLIARWRFVVPAEYGSVAAWGVGAPGGGGINTDVKRPVKSSGPVTLVHGPTVIWFGGHDVLSSRLSAYIVFDGEPPHYLAFGEAESPNGPPQKLEGITFAAHDHPHPLRGA